MDFLEIHKQSLSSIGFWREEYKEIIIQIIELNYKTEILKDYYIDDLVINKEKVLINWKKRYLPLSDEELKKRYDRTVE
jgi:hypothetical protein